MFAEPNELRAEEEASSRRRIERAVGRRSQSNRDLRFGMVLDALGRLVDFAKAERLILLKGSTALRDRLVLGSFAQGASLL